MGKVASRFRAIAVLPAPPVPPILPVLLAALVVAASGCAAPEPEGVSLRPPDPQNWLFPADLDPISDYTVIEAIRQLRPRWLRARGPSITLAGGATRVERGDEIVRVYLDEIQASLRRLEVIPVDNVLRIHYLDAIRATTRFGIDHEGGAIMVTTRGG